MKRAATVSILLLATMVSVAERIAPPMLSPSAFADTEASTNIAIMPLVGGRSFTVSLSLDAAESNCVEVAVGHDAAPTDGVLSHAEASLRFGWNCGCWFLDAPSLTNRLEIASAGQNVRKTAQLRLGVRANDTVREIVLLDGATPLLPNQPAIMLPKATSWNLLRVMTRGSVLTLENLEVRNSPDGTQLIFR